MARRSMLLIVPTLVLTLAFGVTLGAALRPLGVPVAPGVAAAQQATATPGTAGAPTRRIDVSGEGRIAVTPDLAYLVLGVETTNADLAQAQSENAARMTAVLDTLKARGIAERDLQTVGYNIFPQNDRDGQQTGWRVANAVRVTVRDINTLSDLIGQATAAGATRVSSISFDVANKDDAIRRAREAAMADARVKAEQYARLAGVQLGVPVTIAEESAPSRPPQPAAPAPAAQRGGGPPIEGGENIISLTVRVSYEMR